MSTFDFEFAGWGFDTLTVTGPDPFDSNATDNDDSVGNSTITVNPGTVPTLLTVRDGDQALEDGDSSQDLVGATTFNGVNFANGEEVEIEYAYILRPAGSSDPADNITIFVLEFDGDVQGIAATDKLEPGVTYDIVDTAFNSSPNVAYSELFVCFATETLIETPAGERPVEALVPGDLVMTRDHGAQPLRWAGRRRLDFATAPDSQKPVLFRAGSLGAGLPRRDLIVSPQHRMLMAGPQVAASFGNAEVLALAKGMTGLSGARAMQGRRHVDYVSLLFDRHEVILAEGAPSESFHPGPYSLSLLGPRMQLEILNLVPRLLVDPRNGYGPLARPALKRREVEDFLRIKGNRPLSGDAWHEDRPQTERPQQCA